MKSTLNKETNKAGSKYPRLIQHKKNGHVVLQYTEKKGIVVYSEHPNVLLGYELQSIDILIFTEFSGSVTLEAE